jgi:hypothetical protein
MRELAELAAKATGAGGMYMISPEEHTGAGGYVMTLEERDTPSVYADMTDYQKVLWTFMAGQPAETAEIDRHPERDSWPHLDGGKGTHAIGLEDRRPTSSRTTVAVLV